MGAERADAVAQVGVADGGGDLGAGRDTELHAGGADAAGRAVDEQALAGPQAGLREERVVRGGEHLRNGAGLDPAQALGHRHQLALVDDAQLGLPAAADHRHDAIAVGESLGAGPAGRHLAGELEARDVLRRARRRRVMPAELMDVGTVEAGRADADQHLARARLWIGVLGDDELAIADGGGTHGRGV